MATKLMLTVGGQATEITSDDDLVFLAVIQENEDVEPFGIAFHRESEKLEVMTIKDRGDGTGLPIPANKSGRMSGNDFLEKLGITDDEDFDDDYDDEDDDDDYDDEDDDEDEE